MAHTAGTVAVAALVVGVDGVTLAVEALGDMGIAGAVLGVAVDEQDMSLRLRDGPTLLEELEAVGGSERAGDVGARLVFAHVQASGELPRFNIEFELDIRAVFVAREPEL